MLLNRADTNLYSGTITEYYNSCSQKKFEELYQNGDKDGDYVSWYKNGAIKVAGQFSKNKRVGLWKWFKKNGDLEYSFNYQLS